MKLKYDSVPTKEQLEADLADIPAWPGSTKTIGKDYVRYVVALSQNEKQKYDKYATFWLPYITVDGRVRMFSDAHAESNAKYNETIFNPSEYVKIPTDENVDAFLVVGITIDSELWGIRQDMAVADTSRVGRGGNNADSTKPYENATTSARGRVIASFGVGIIPTMGMASAEEMMSALESKSTEITPQEGSGKTARKPSKKLSDKVAETADVSVHKKKNFEKALTIFAGKGTAEDLVNKHIEERKAQGVQLDENYLEWNMVEIIKLQNTAKL